MKHVGVLIEKGLAFPVRIVALMLILIWSRIPPDEDKRRSG